MKKAVSLLFLLTSIAISAQSVLSSGTWMKVGITTSGVYKLDKDFITGQLKFSKSINPATLKIYGIAGGMLPQENAIARPSDPVELAIYGFGDQDGTLDDNDYFLFYGQGPHDFHLNSNGDPIFNTNIYSDTAYFFVTHGGQLGKRISIIDSAPVGQSPTSEFTEYFIHELDLYNQLRSGRSWLGEQFRRNNDRIRHFNFEIASPGTLAQVWLKVGASSEYPCSFDVSINDLNVGNVSVNAIPQVQYGEKLKYAQAAFQSNINSDEIKLTLSFNAGEGSSSSLGYLDQFIVGVKRTLTFSDQDQLHIYGMPGVQTAYRISETNEQTVVWDVSSPLSPKQFDVNSTNNSIAFTKNNEQHTFVIIDLSGSLDVPEVFHPVSNQNIKSLTANEGIIVTHPEFLSEAERLANFHENTDGLSVGIVTTQQIYNEFSSGRQDLTAIRDFLKYCHEQSGLLEQVLLFGDASYDYKYRVSNNTNFVPVYESRESASNLYSHSSDDYIAFFEEDEGNWSEDSIRENSLYVLKYGQDHTMDVGIGRLPVTSVKEAQIVVDKIIRYKTSSQQFGKWRNEVAYFADDGDGNIHMIQAESLSKIVDTVAANVNLRKLYLDRYDQRETGSESEALTVTKNALKDGIFMFNYMGHGNEQQLTRENIINLDWINSLSNRNKLPLFITATCEFGKYDNPARVSGAERLLIHENGGGIALLTTSRPVYANTNFPLNQALHENLFKVENGKHLRLGEIIRRTKNEALEGSINRNFALLGDPMLTLNYPQYNVIFDQMNDQKDTLSALENYRLSGRIVSDGQTVTDFTGQAIVTLYDIPQTKVTRGQENNPFQFSDQTNAIFRGEVSVNDGVFDMEFVLPQNISYKYQSGKITIYAWDQNGHQDATGATNNFVLGGSSDSNSSDAEPPRVKLYLNDHTFRNGTTVGPNSLVIAQITDESGINITNDGLTRGISLQLNDREPIDLNGYFTATRDTYKEGTVLFPLQNMEAGKYTATLKVLDSHNNISTTTVDFKVSDKPVIRLYNALNYPNPVSLSRNATTTFKFEHDREDERLIVSIYLYNMEGQLMRKANFDLDGSPRQVDNLELTMADHHGVTLQAGMYLYRLVVTSTLDHATNEIAKRLIIIN